MWMVVEPAKNGLFDLNFDSHCPHGATLYKVTGRSTKIKAFAKDFGERFGDLEDQLTMEQIDEFIAANSDKFSFEKQPGD